ncbi:MAG: asparagine synthase (glutamine-hydrolyzing) [Geminicoccaceae bacterium]|nr:asparagine synthase (glutamine-hydrolyzing) [Geminicoccaceae bacterium]
MCGFAGVLDPGEGRAGVLDRLARAMVAPIRHRGPDDLGVHLEPEAGLALGFRRLAIRDLSPAGHQPMVSASGRFVIVYNGELYNAEELEAALAARGIRPRGRSDTEVLLEHLACFGLEPTLERSLGMFAFALWDRAERTLALARDRLGKKPLYWGLERGRLRFGSQLQCLLADPAFRPAIDRTALGLYLRLGYVPGTRSILEGVAKLAPGTWLRIDARGEIATGRYWDPVELVARGLAEPFAASEDELLDRFEDLLFDAVRRRLVSDVPLGAFLSGGIDSATVVALAQKASPRPLATFTIGSPDPAFDESAQAAAIARALGTDHHSLLVGPEEALATVPELPRWFDEPFADASAIPTLLVARLARERVTVALSGDGGDELFLGYRRYHEALALARRLAPLPPALRRGAARLLAAIPEPAWSVLGRLAPKGLEPERLAERVRRFARVLAGPAERASLEIAAHWGEPALLGVPDVVPEGYGGELAGRVPDLATRLQLLDLSSWLPEDILTKLDRASMAVSLEARCPLLDHRLLAFVFRLPPSLRGREGTSKYLLRRLLARHLPAELIDRGKRGFSLPIHDWLRGRLRPWAEDLLDPRRLGEAGLVDPRPVRRLWQQHLEGRCDRRFPLWNLLMLEAWRRHWLAPASRAVPEPVAG